MHFCKSEFEFVIAKSNIYNKWVQNGLSDFREYFDSQWVRNGKFNKWVFFFLFWILIILNLIKKQIYHSPKGFASTNNPCESHNKYIKLKFTNYESMSLHQLLQIICEDLIPYFSKNSADKSLMRYRVADAKTKSEVRVLSNISFHQPIDNHNNFIYYFGISSIYQINPIQKTCTCRWNLAIGTCKHIYK